MAYRRGVLLTERRSKLPAPSRLVLDALVNETKLWWISVEGEREPPIAASDGVTAVTYASPFLWRPRDVIELRVEADGQGSVLRLRHTSPEPFTPLEARAIGHRWGEHVDRDLRDRFDHGGRPSGYETSLYRGDVADWSIVDRVLDRMWRARERTPVLVATPTSRGATATLKAGELVRGDLVWAGEMGRRGLSVGCRPLAAPGIEVRVTAAAEVFVPLAEFDRRLELVESRGAANSGVGRSP